LLAQLQPRQRSFRIRCANGAKQAIPLVIGRIRDCYVCRKLTRLRLRPTTRVELARGEDCSTASAERRSSLDGISSDAARQRQGGATRYQFGRIQSQPCRPPRPAQADCRPCRVSHDKTLSASTPFTARERRGRVSSISCYYEMMLCQDRSEAAASGSVPAWHHLASQRRQDR
jgi:hypothetical protein